MDFKGGINRIWICRVRLNAQKPYIVYGWRFNQHFSRVSPDGSRRNADILRLGTRTHWRLHFRRWWW